MRKPVKRLPLSLIAAVLAMSTIGTPAAWAAGPRGGRQHDAPTRTFVTPTPPASELGTTVAEVASRHRLPTAELERRLKKDRRLKIGRGRLMVQEAPLADMLEGAGVGTVTAAGALTAGTPAPADALTLHSLPGSKRVIYLDFNGEVLSGDVWSASYNGGTNIVAPPFDTDGSPSTFSDSERNVIIGAWQRVAEDYVAFDVDVTTEYPGESSITRSSSSDEYYGMRVLVSPMSSYVGAYGGIAYIGVYDLVGDYYRPALVFPERLANNEKYIGEACAHECGHTLGLYHDGTTAGVSYYGGHGTGDTSWAPIMGNSYSRNLTQWSKGEYPVANNKEDDLAIVQSNGLPVRADDYGNSSAAAHAVASGTTFGLSGLIERNNDLDAFSLSAGAGALTVNVTPATRGSDMDLLAELRDSSGTLVASSNPADLLSATMSVNVPAGTYYLTVKGTGKGDLATGYSSYACLGSYLVSGTMTPGTVVQVPPTASAKATPSSGAAPLATQFDSSLTSDADGTIVSWYWAFGDGATSTVANPSHTYASAGSYSAWLTVTDNSGLTATANVIVTVASANVAPKAAMSASPLSGVAPVTANFSAANSTDSDGSIVGYAWSYGDGTSGTGISCAHTYTAAGTYTARLTVTDNAGATGSSSVTITVTRPNAAPVPVISVTPASGYVPLATKFSAAASYDSDGSITSYKWDFGDGTSGSGKTSSHTYKSAGTYKAVLTVVDNGGTMASTWTNVVVKQDPKKIAHVASIVLTKLTYSPSQAVSARVRVVGPDGLPISGVTASGSWGAVVTGSAKANTNSSGYVSVTSPRFTVGGTVTFTIDSLVKAGYVYDSGSNVVTTASLALGPR